MLGCSSMKSRESDIENIFLERLKSHIGDKSLRIVSQDSWKTSILTRWFDIVIYKRNYPLVVCEIKSSLRNKSTLAGTTDQVRSSISITNARFGVVTDNEVFYIYDRNEKENSTFYFPDYQHQQQHNQLIYSRLHMESLRIF